jgi:hypothetical protein
LHNKGLGIRIISDFLINGMPPRFGAGRLCGRERTAFWIVNGFFVWEKMEKSEIRDWITTLAARIDHIRDWL